MSYFVTDKWILAEVSLIDKQIWFVYYRSNTEAVCIEASILGCLYNIVKMSDEKREEVWIVAASICKSF